MATKNEVKFFGREPIIWISLIEATLFLIVANGLNWSQDQVGVVMAVVLSAFGVYIAWVTKNTLLGVLTGFTKAVFTLLITFGINIEADNMAAILGFVTVVVGFFHRTQTGVMAEPSFSDPELVDESHEAEVLDETTLY